MANKTYLYLCPYCGARFESLIKPNSPVKCVECGTRPCRQIEENDE